MDKFTLRNGIKIPKIGFGTYKSVTSEDKDVILKALQVGYKHFDTASFYDNEEILGESIEKSGIRRDELFLTSKVWKEEMGYDNTIKAVNKSLIKLKTNYLDLCLIHWPKANINNEDWRKLDKETWRALETLYNEGKVKAIGLSNFHPHHIMNLLESANVKPMVNQIEFHPGYMQKAVVDYCQGNDILVEAWSPIGRGRVFNEPLLKELANKYNKSIPQICIRFALQLNVLPLPKSSCKERMIENMSVFDFEIEIEDMYRLMCLPQIGWSGEHPDRPREMV